MMELNAKQSRIITILAMVFGAIGMFCCVVSIVSSVTDSVHSKYVLTAAIILLGLNRICLHIGRHEGNFFYNFCVTGAMFVLATFVALSSISIYFLTVSFFIYGLLIAVNHAFMIYHDRSASSIILNSLIIAFCFLYSFIFLFPAIYEKHATSVSNWNFIVLSYTMIVFFTCFKNALLPVKEQLKLDTFLNKIRQALAMKIIMGLLVLVTLCSIYFTLVEPGMISFADSLWYCFSVITTIGFGDVTITTTLGRILSVILGLYGIVVVGLVTSIIVTIYNNVNQKKNDDLLEKTEKRTEEIINKELNQDENHEQNVDK